MHRSIARLAGILAVAGSSCLLGLSFAPTASSAPAEAAIIRAAHFSPDTPGVDVYLTAFSGGTTRLWVPNAEYGGVSPYQRIDPGLYVVAMRPHGAAVSTPPVISWNLDVKAGQAYTTAAIGSNKALRSVVLHDDLTLPAGGTGRVRLVQAASRVPTADVGAVGGPLIANQVAFATTTGYTTVPAGTWSLEAHGTGTSSGLTASARVSVPSGTVMSLLLLDAPGAGITLRSVLDAAGAGQVPVGSVPAGGGGTAEQHIGQLDSRMDLLWLAGLAAMAGVVALAAGRHRRPGLHRGA